MGRAISKPDRKDVVGYWLPSSKLTGFKTRHYRHYHLPEPDEVKVSRPVLRGAGGGDALFLPGEDRQRFGSVSV